MPNENRWAVPPGACDTRFHIWDTAVSTVKSNFPDEMDLLDTLRSWVSDEATWRRSTGFSDVINKQLV